MIDDLAKTVTKLISKVPGGVLIFFPSYRVMSDTYDRWQKKGGLKDILQHKSVYREPQNSNEYQLVIDRFYSDVYEGEKRGAVLLGVCRGRISEGLDFSDHAARMVLIVGIPFPNLFDAKVILKRNYLDSKPEQ